MASISLLVRVAALAAYPSGRSQLRKEQKPNRTGKDNPKRDTQLRAPSGHATPHALKRTEVYCLLTKRILREASSTIRSSNNPCFQR